MANFYCPNCEGVFDEYVERTEKLGDWMHTYSCCPYCGETGIRLLVPCPSCNGMMEDGEKICAKCQGRVMHEWGVFLRSMSLAELEWLEDKVEGEPWEVSR